jgi:hypothetical protein
MSQQDSSWCGSEGRLRQARRQAQAEIPAEEKSGTPKQGPREWVDSLSEKHFDQLRQAVETPSTATSTKRRLKTARP